MSKCCVVEHDGAPPMCPVNGQTCKPVGRVTLESLLNDETKASLSSQPYYFCDAVDCDTVYVSATAEHLITKDQLTVRVGIKETEDPIPLCYCFDFDRKSVREDIRLKGSTDIPVIITRRVKSGECRCDKTNPSGTCCLGDIYRAVKQAQAMKQKGLI